MQCALAITKDGQTIMAIGVLPGVMTPELGDALFVIDGVALVLFFVVVYAEEIAAGSSRVFKLLSPSFLASRIRLWRAAHKGH